MIQKHELPNPALHQARTAETNLMIQEHLIAGLKNAFSDKGFQYSNSPNPVATLPSPCTAFGTLALFDDGDEATVYLGGATHRHFGCDDDQLSEAQKEAQIAAEVIAFTNMKKFQHTETANQTRGPYGGEMCQFPIWTPLATRTSQSSRWPHLSRL